MASSVSASAATASRPAREVVGARGACAASVIAAGTAAAAEAAPARFNRSRLEM